MTGYQDPHDPMQHQQLRPPKKGWFARHWWWFLPLVIIGPIVLCCGGFGLMGYFGVQKGMEELKKLPAYQNSITAMESHPEVTKALGTPIEVAGLFEAASAGHQMQVTETNFDASYPVSGPNGSGVLTIRADVNASGQWEWQELTLQVDGGDKINLLSSTGITPDPALFPDGVPDDTDESPEDSGGNGGNTPDDETP